MRYIKNLCWFLVLVWLTTVAFNSVYEIYAVGGFWRLAAWIMVLTGISLWVVGLRLAFSVIKKVAKRDTIEETKGDEKWPPAKTE